MIMSSNNMEEEKLALQEKWHEKVFRPNRTVAPAYLDKEPIDHYRKRLMNKATPFVAKELQQVKTEHLYGSALDHYEQKYLESAAAEVGHPTNIQEGTLKQVTKYDQAGRPFYEFYGSPRAWLDDFSAPKKQLVGIYAPGLNFQKV
jgi:hypothetical protein